MKKPLQVLVVEDNEDDRFLLRRYFKKYAEQGQFAPLKEARNMQEAVQALQKQRFACVLLDLGLPDGAGISNISRLHALYPDLPIIIFTGLNDELTAISATEAGARQYVVKHTLSPNDSLAQMILDTVNTPHQSRVAAESRGGSPYFIETATGEITDWSAAAQTMLGYPNSEMLGHSSAKIVGAGHRADLQIASQRVRAGGNELQIELPMLTRDGSARQLRLTAQPLAHEKVRWTLQDMTRERKAWHDSQVLEAIVQSSPDAVIATDLDGRIVVWNPGAQRMLGYSEQQMLGRPYGDLIPNERGNEADDILQALKRGSIIRNLQTRRRTQRDGDLDVSISLSPLRDEKGGLVGGASISRDISEQIQAAGQLQRLNSELERKMEQLKCTQSQLVQQQKLAGLGEMVAGMAHEVATPVGVGRMAASVLNDETTNLLKALQSDSLTRSKLDVFVQKAAEAANIIETNMERAADLMNAFKIVSVDQASQAPRHFDMAEYLNQTLLNLQPKLKQLPHQITVDCPDELQMLSIPGAWSQIVTNLVLNSCMHGFPDGHAGKISITVEAIGDDGVRLIHRDDGRGIEATFLPKIWDRYYTSKRDSGGSGIGLDVVRQQVEIIGGKVKVESRQGMGVCFTVTAPRELNK